MDVYVNKRYLGLLNVVSTRKLKKKQKNLYFHLNVGLVFLKKISVFQFRFFIIYFKEVNWVPED